MPLPVTRTQRPDPRPVASSGPAPEEPGWLDGDWDNFKGVAGLAIDEIPGRENLRRNAAYMAAIEAMTDINGEWGASYIDGGWNMGTSSVNEDRFWTDLEAVRAKNPDALKGFPKSRAEFDKLYSGAVQLERTRNEQAAAGAGLVVQFAGGMAGTMLDPVNLMTLPVGGGKVVATGLKGVAETMLREGAVNALIELGETPLIDRERELQGREGVTVGEAAQNAAFAFGGGAILSGLMRGGGEAVMAGKEKLSALIMEKWDQLPPSIRQRMARGEPVTSEQLPDLVETLVGRENMDEQLQSAVDLVRRENELQGGSPMLPTGAGQDMHARLMGEALDAAINAPAPPTRRFVPGESPVVPAGREASTAIGRAMPGDGAVDRFMGKTRRVESSGDDAAKNPRSSATGRYQFTDGTWLERYKSRFGSQGMTDAQILAKRGDGALQDVLMRDLTEANAAFLRRRGEAVTEGNLYLVHFAGQGGTSRLLDADPAASVRSVLGDEVVNANPFLKDMTVRDVFAWADRKMGSANVRRGGGSLEADPLATRTEAEQAQVQAELDRINARIAELDEANARPVVRGEDIEADPAPLPDIEPARIDVAEDAVPVETSLRETQTTPADPLLPQLRDVVRDRSRSLNQLDQLADELGVPVEDVRRGLNQLAGDGTITMNRKTGNFMRKREQPDADELLEFIAAKGGMADNEGHGLGLKGLSERERAELVPAAQKRLIEKRKTGSRDLQRMTRGNGWLLRHEGRSVDEIGELLAEAGWFTDRPTTAQVLDLIESRVASGKPMYPPGHAKAEGQAPRGQGDAELDVAIEAVRGAGWYAEGLTDIELTRAGIVLAENPHLSPEDAIDRMIAEEAVAVRDAAIDETKDVDLYDTDYDDPFAIPFDPADDWRFARGVGEADGAGGAGREGQPGDAGASREGGEPDPFAEGERLSDLPDAERTAFLDPEGPAAARQADDLAHEAKASVERSATDANATDSVAEVPGASFEAEEALGDALTRIEGDDAARLGRDVFYKGDDAVLDELAQQIDAGGDPDKIIKKALKDGRLERVEGEEPPVADVQPMPPSEVVPAPERTVKMAEQAGPEISPADAAGKVQAWKDEAKRIGRENPPPEGSIILSLFDESGAWSQPYRDMGYEVYQLDIKNGHDLSHNMVEYMNWIEDARAGGARIVGVIAQPPCTTFAGSGARWWKPRHNKAWPKMVERMFGKQAVKDGFDSPLEYNRFLVATTEELIARSDPEFFVMENPVGRIEKMTGLPAPLMAIEPHHFGDPYTKRTHLWGKFNTVLDGANVHPAEGSRMHKLRSNAEKDGGLRSKTPEGFAYSFALANRPGTEGVTKAITDAGDPGAARLDNGAAVDPAIAARQAQEAQLQAEAPLRGENRTGQAQDGTMGMGLFDAVDQPGFRLDVDGEPRALSDLLADIEADEADIKTIRDCM